MVIGLNALWFRGSRLLAAHIRYLGMIITIPFSKGSNSTWFNWAIISEAATLVTYPEDKERHVGYVFPYCILSPSNIYLSEQ